MKTPALEIRPAEMPDLPAVLDLYRHLNSDTDRPSVAEAEAVFERFLAYAGSVILLGLIGGVPVASCTLVIVPNLTRGARPYALVENVVTHADHRRRGFGRKVLDAACDAAWAAGCYKVMLMTGSTRPETLAFYARAGFEQSKTGFQKRRGSGLLPG
ncbi:GNAT family N-acetyltransferase [Psychromarinibacter sp. S121]|uniref:GNAT family N-acetyltransferase n=1 Tax=Psychromarinibacter sp. S121 TaxID=3415127 RepID=UPI003C7AE655